MRRQTETLLSVNPTCAYLPANFGETERAKFRFEATQFTDGLSKEFGETFTLSHETNIQDSTLGAIITLPPSLIIGNGPVIPCIRISNHERLFVISVLRRVSQKTEEKIEMVAERFRFDYTPEPIFGEPFDTRERCNWDLFNQLYDWV